MTRSQAIAGCFWLGLGLSCGGREGLLEVSLPGSSQAGATGQAGDSTQGGNAGAVASSAGGAAGVLASQGGAGNPQNQGGMGAGAPSGQGGVGGVAGLGGAGGGLTSCSIDAVTLCSGPCGDPCSAIPAAMCVKAYDLAGATKIGFCDYPGGPRKGGFCFECKEDQACSTVFPTPFPEYPVLVCVPRELCQAAVELGQSGCYFSDKSTFSLDPIPDPTSCPTIPGLDLCGGACGECKSGEWCTGRSPLHPLGFCVNHYEDQNCGSDLWPCKAGLCFVHASLPETTAFAQQNGVCLPAGACLAAATQLPGGGACVDGKGEVLTGKFLAGP